MTTFRSRFPVATLAKAATALLVVSALAGCSTNFGAPTDQVYVPTRGMSDRSGDVDVLNALVVSGTEGTGTVVATLVNNLDEPDRLADVTIDGESTQVAAGREAVEIAAGGHNNLGESGAVSAESESIVPGTFVELTFTFDNAESVSLQAPVVHAEGDYKDVPLPGSS